MICELRYSSFAMPTYGIKLDKVYSLVKDGEKYYIADSTNKICIDLQEIKSLFSPIGKTWTDVFKTKVSDSKKNS